MVPDECLRSTKSFEESTKSLKLKNLDRNKNCQSKLGQNKIGQNVYQKQKAKVCPNNVAKRLWPPKKLSEQNSGQIRSPIANGSSLSSKNSVQ